MNLKYASTFLSLFAVLSTWAAAQSTYWAKTSNSVTQRSASFDRSYGPDEINGRSVANASTEHFESDLTRNGTTVHVAGSHFSSRLEQYATIFGHTGSVVASAYATAQNGRCVPQFGSRPGSWIPHLLGWSYTPGPYANGRAEVFLNGSSVWSKALNYTTTFELGPPVVREIVSGAMTWYIPTGVVNIPVELNGVALAVLAGQGSVTVDVPSQTVAVAGIEGAMVSGGTTVTCGWSNVSVGIGANIDLAHLTIGIQLQASPTGNGGQLTVTFTPVAIQLVAFGGITLTVTVPLPFGLSVRQSRFIGFSCVLLSYTSPSWSTSRTLF